MPRSGSARIFFYRHAESDKNINIQLVGGRSNSAKLTDRGEQQGPQLGDALRAENRHFDAAYASSAGRARRTGALAFGRAGIDLDIIPRDALLEYSPGNWERRDRNQPLQRADGTFETYKRVRDLGWDGHVEGGETPREVARRMIGEFTEIAEQHPGGDVAIFGHAISFRIVVMHMTGRFDYVGMKVPFCSESLFTYQSGVWRPEYAGAHMLPGKPLP